MFDVNVRKEKGSHVAYLAGELDCDEERRCIEALQAVPEQVETKLVIDMTGVTFMDSTGIKFLLLADSRARCKGLRRPLIRGAAPNVMRVLEMTGVASRLQIEAGTGAKRSRTWPASAEHPSRWGNRLATP